MRVRVGEGEGVAAALDNGPVVLVWVVRAATPLPYPDMFKHLHGGKSLEGTDETLWGTEASDNIWDSREERLSPPLQKFVSVRKGEASVSVGPHLHPPASSPKSLSQLSVLGCCPAPPRKPVEASPLARAVHLLGGLELHIAGGGLWGWGLGVCAVYLPCEEQRVVSQAAA